jgi:hypothetical protein
LFSFGVINVNFQAKTQEQDERFVSRKQLAERWGVCSHTIQRNPLLSSVAIRMNSRLVRYPMSAVVKIEAAAKAGNPQGKENQ